MYEKYKKKNIEHKKNIKHRNEAGLLALSTSSKNLNTDVFVT